MIPLLDYHAMTEARYQSQRRAFARRHNKVSVPWLMFCIGFALGIGLMLVATQ